MVPDATYNREQPFPHGRQTAHIPARNLSNVILTNLVLLLELLSFCVHQVYEEFEGLWQEHLQDHFVMDQVASEQLAARVRTAVARGRTAKYECLLIKVLSNTKQTVQQQNEAILRYTKEFVQAVKVSPSQVMHEAILREMERVKSLPS